LASLSSLTLQSEPKNKEKGDETMHIHSNIASTALSLIVILLIGGVWLLLLRVLKLPWSLRSTTLDQARQLVYLNDAFMLLMAGALWIVAWATAQFTESWGIVFITTGVIYLILGLRWKAGEKP
jgi:hypothetical protein